MIEMKKENGAKKQTYRALSLQSGRFPKRLAARLAETRCPLHAQTLRHPPTTCHRFRRLGPGSFCKVPRRSGVLCQAPLLKKAPGLSPPAPLAGPHPRKLQSPIDRSINPMHARLGFSLCELGRPLSHAVTNLCSSSPRFAPDPMSF